ncbi:MAG TPA: phosphotransferase [Steroidobacteraceae bacterium]
MAANLPRRQRLSGPAPEALACVPGLESGQPPKYCGRLRGGTVNEVWRIDTSQGRFVLRVDGASWRRPGVERSRECALHQLAAAAGLAPPLIATRPRLGVLVTEFLDGRMWSARQCRSPASLTRLGERLAQLHALTAPPIGRFDPFAVGRAYAALAPRSADTRSDPRPVLQRLESVLLQLDRRASAPSIIHGDLVHTNILEGRAVWLLDWEYAQVAEPLFDIACLFSYYPPTSRGARRLLTAAGLAADAAGGRLEQAIFVYRALNWLWYRARGQVRLRPVLERTAGTGVAAGGPAN